MEKWELRAVRRGGQNMVPPEGPVSIFLVELGWEGRGQTEYG